MQNEFSVRPDAAPALHAPRGSLARRLLDLARARGLDIEGNGELKRAIADADGRGTREIPEPALMAVAELLAYIYGARTHWTPPLPGKTGEPAP
jgi:type III secretion system FlhB-like substrate exporter